VTTAARLGRPLVSLAAAFAVVAIALVPVAPAHAAVGDQAIEGTVTVTGLIGTLNQGVVTADFIGEPSDPDADGAIGIVQADGTFRIDLYIPGDYRICIQEDQRNWEGVCWQGGAIITVGAGEVVTGKNITTQQYGGISGELMSDDGTGPVANGSLIARVFEKTPGGYFFVDEVGTGWPFTANYRFNSLPPGDYAVQYAHLEGWYSHEYWEDARYFSQRTDVTVTPGASEVLGATVLDPREYDRARIAGADRFATAVGVSKQLFPTAGTDVPVVYIANGLNYPDALAAGPAAAYLGGSLLLVTPTSIPASVAAELQRLDPQRIVVVGGPTSVNASVKSALEAYVPSPSDVDRIGGPDRFSTSRMIVADAWGSDASAHVFLATGLNFPDALAAVPAAGVRGAPIILVPGSAGTLDTATRSLITGLDTEYIHIVGSGATVSDGIEANARSLVGPDNVVRYAGFNRFATAVLVSIGNFGNADSAFVATGMGFADALAGGPLAASVGAPMYLSNGTCLEPYVLADIEAVGANGVVLLGSEATLAGSVYNLTSCPSSISGGNPEEFIRTPSELR
jgi:putative cell wall-binding protein